MIEYKVVKREKAIPDKIKCDVCKNRYDVSMSDSLEAQEFTHIDYYGGYDSIFGDESRIECDICQHCVKKLIGKYLRIS